MSFRVMKVGGSCLTDIDSLNQLTKISELWPFNVIVVSAFKGVTDALYDAYFGSHRSEYVSGLIREFSKELSKKKLGTEDILFKRILSMIRFSDVDDFIEKIDECTLDFYVSLGEQISGAICTIYLEDNHDAIYMDSIDTGIFIRKVDDVNKIDLDRSVNLHSEKLEEFLGKKTIVTTGFYGLNESGNIAIAGRNSSDYVASVLAVKFRADVLVLFKDVDGIYQADPKIEHLISPIREMNYEQAMRYSMEGAIIHPDAVRICSENDIKIHVMGYNSLKIGTTIGRYGSITDNLFFPETI
ncbi:MAG: hypothetical protein M1323_04185 [Candidatus Thermoplasmatota archaeon]|nr:hypothetical protein [Candidatus Thermoplasmatota archaeon]